MCDIPTEIPQCEPLEEVSRLAFRKIPNPGCLLSSDLNQYPFSIKVGTSKVISENLNDKISKYLVHGLIQSW